MKRITEAVRQAIMVDTNIWAMFMSLERMGAETKALVNDASIMALCEQCHGQMRRNFQARVEP